MRTTKKITVMLTILAFVMSFATTVFAEGYIDWEKGVIRATGMAAGKRDEKNPGLKRAQARRAARMDAQRNLAEAVMGVQVTATSSMQDLALEHDQVKTAVAAIINNIREAGEPKFNDDGTCEITLEMALFGSRSSVAEAAFLPFKTSEKKPFPQPSTMKNSQNEKTKVAGATTEKNTGLIVDCRGLNLQPVMSPVIKNDSGDPIYGFENLDYDKVIEYGMASYVRSTNDEAASRAGDNPIVVKAVKVENFKANPVITVSDADSVLIANQGDHFLDDCAVVFIR